MKAEIVKDPFAGTVNVEAERRNELVEMNDRDLTREALERDYGEVMDTSAVNMKYQVISFMAPYVLVVRLSDGKRGTLKFTHLPRWYHSFEEE